MESTEILERARDFLQTLRRRFICLRCGECCFAWEVKMPDGSRKPERENCKYLLPRRIEEGKWQEATCMIHETLEYPQECREAVIGFGFCPIGTFIWKHLKEQNPEAEIPENAKKAIEFYYIQGK